MAAKRDRSPFFSRKNIRGIVFTAVLAASFFIPTPYYLYQSGSAEELAPMITVEKGQKDEKGTLMLTTVASIHATNIYYLAYGYIAPHTELHKEEEVKHGMSDQEYSKLLKHMMDSSQQNAIISGFEAAGETVKYNYNGVFVKSILPESKAKGQLQVGDIITLVDGLPVHQVTDMTDYLNSKKKLGDTVEVTFKRDEEERKATLTLISFDSQAKDPSIPTHRIGIGVQPENQLTLDLPRKVNIHAEEIGGPSAGLMFSLEIYSQLTNGDLTKGYRIAGTGTMDPKGNVGQIGGIQHKIIAADREKADIFFAPKDIEEYDSNTKDVLQAAKENNIKIKIVPVATLQEAIDYLNKLEPKK